MIFEKYIIYILYSLSFLDSINKIILLNSEIIILILFGLGATIGCRSTGLFFCSTCLSTFAVKKKIDSKIGGHDRRDILLSFTTLSPLWYVSSVPPRFYRPISEPYPLLLIPSLARSSPIPGRSAVLASRDPVVFSA